MMLLLLIAILGEYCWCSSLSYNQLKFCPTATWDSIATTFSNISSVGTHPYGIFVNTKNTVYVAANYFNEILMWPEESITPTRIICSGLNGTNNIFVTNNGDIYVDNGAHNGQVDRWAWNATSSVPVMNVTSRCRGLFIDINNTLYCSNDLEHKVIKTSLMNGLNTATIVAGTGRDGSQPHMLYNPNGIYVDMSFSLYVADCGNHRIQVFQPGQLNGTTVAGNGAPETIALACPSGIVLDSDGYLFIVDHNNHRIVGSGPAGFRCLVGCSGTGLALNQLDHPSTFAFDSYGNIFVVDSYNSRIQKFLLATNSCAVSYNQPKFCPTAMWNPNPTAIADISVVGSSPHGIFVSINNTVYVAATNLNQVLVWTEGSIVPTRNISQGLDHPYSVFVTTGGDIYVDNGEKNSRVDKWGWNATKSVPVMNVTSRCRSLFIDINNTLYCSSDHGHKVVKISLNSASFPVTTAAGNGSSGSESHMLNSPKGIFVDIKLNLYVADNGNDRIQVFQPGHVNGTTVAGSEVTGTIALKAPNGIALDADGYLFIIDYDTQRIIGSGPNGFRCLIGCLGSNGPVENQLHYPRSFSFDSYGNIFVSGSNNAHIQKFILTSNSCGPSYNQPKLCPSATWNSDAITLADNCTIGTQPWGVFVNNDNTVYIADKTAGRVHVWLEGNTTLWKTIYGDLNQPFTVFVTINGDVYVDNGQYHGRVDKWTSNGTNSTAAMYVNSTCRGLFVDLYDNIYCSMESLHQVVKKSFNDDANMSTVVAGNGIKGAARNMLNNPQGIFVDITFNLYVADCGNKRIQLFQSGQLDGITVAGEGSTGGITLGCPAGVVLNANGYLYISDYDNNRIVQSRLNHLRCLVGCRGWSGSAPFQLKAPRSLSFDSYGNIFVVDGLNDRIQKFLLATDSCNGSLTSNISPTVVPFSPLNTCLETVSQQTTQQQPPLSFIPKTCSNTNVGFHCNISNVPCDILKPCQNNGTCQNNNTTSHGYTCSCPSHFKGADCQSDHRPCKPDTCWNNGICNETSNTTFHCACESGWEGIHCETKINYCQNETCENKGVCRPLFLNFTCECLGDSYYGRYCETTDTKMFIYKTISKSFAYIAIIAMISVAMFIVIMDILKYCFGIDPVRKELELIRREKQARKRKPVIQRFIYVNAPPPSQELTSTIAETTV